MGKGFLFGEVKFTRLTTASLSTLQPLLIPRAHLTSSLTRLSHDTVLYPLPIFSWPDSSCLTPCTQLQMGLEPWVVNCP